MVESLAASRWARIGAIAMVVAATGAASGVLGWRRYLAALAGEARTAIASGRLDDAEKSADRWVRLSRGAGDALLMKARVAMARGRHDDAYALALRARASGASRDEARLVSAILGVKAGYLAESEPILAAAFEAPHEPDPQLDEALARVYLERFDMPRASAVIARWMADAPGDARPYLWRAEIDRRIAGAEGELIVDYREALSRDPALAEARLGLADVLRTSHRYDESARHYAAYLAMRPDDPAGELGAGQAALAMADPPVARRHLDRAIELAPSNPRAYKLRADLAMRLGEAGPALADLDHAARLDPFDAETRYARALALGRLGRAAEAGAEHAAARRLRADDERLATLQARLVREPDDREAQAEVARWLCDHGHPDEGIRWAEKIVKECPDHRDANRLLADHHDRLGNAGLANYYRLRAGGEPVSAPVGKKSSD